MKSTVIFGNPGTGKTYDLIERIKKCKALGFHEQSIQVVSHTRTAAQEITRRAEGALANTLHSLAYQYCGLSREQVVTMHELRNFSDKIGIPMKGVSGDGTQLIEAGDEYMAIINKACNTLKDPVNLAHEDMPIIGSVDEFIYFLKSYNNWKHAFGLIDFNDMLKNAIKLVQSKKVTPKFEVLFVDEAQDLSPLQWKFIDVIIAQGNMQIVDITGDPDQALFVWGGADPEGMEKFALKYNAEINELEQSYRVPQEAWKISNKILAKSGSRYSKKYYPTKIRGSVLNISNASQCNWEILHGLDVLIMYRTHSLRKEIEHEIRRFNIPYTALNGRPGWYDNSIGSAIFTFEKICQGEMVTNRALYTLKQNATQECNNMLHKKDFEGLKKLNRSSAIVFPPYAAEYYLNTNFDEKPTIKLSTIHGAKGMEADTVFVLDGMSNRVLENMDVNLDEELKVWFVAVTRTKNKLVWINSMEAEGFEI